MNQRARLREQDALRAECERYRTHVTRLFNDHIRTLSRFRKTISARLF